ncbi:von Willebrand factor type A domain-containing protein [Naegleria gruberi]|uniref:von Willebrand factor type A domain-containing protein n=1 Tax=Naegleria gruberi TaxID=5762 RepID=D2V5D8_NAEGR|nr:von Willebrand factor type A domain-containing protein [Naegleria gruberi]EFC47935.1 von Willebrand factor type A domain-containing protein [Naegleria gruberi]|eukprot:XP_002680679.1 von Willebrand factor type A domain-containing protein [Naegleria gruberi strain NEG-M]
MNSRFLLTIVLLSVFLLACGINQTHARKLPRDSLVYYEKVGNQHRDSVIQRLRQLFKELSDQQQQIELLADSQSDDDFPCPSPYVRKDEDVNGFVAKLQSIKCLDDKLVEFDTYIKSSAILFTVSQSMKIIEQFSKILFVKKHVTTQLISRLSTLTGSEAVTLLKTASDSTLERLKLLDNVKTNIIDIQTSKATIVSSLFDAETKTKATESLDQVKYHDCVFGSISGDNILFTIDTSPSMDYKIAPDSKFSRLDFVKKHFELVLRKLTPNQKFNIDLFNKDAKLLYSEFIQATPENIEKAVQYVKNSIQTSSYTNLEAAMRSSFSAFQSKDSGSKVVYLLSDGVPTAGEQNPQALIRIIDQLSHYSNVKVNSISFNMGNEYNNKQYQETDLDKNNAALILSKVAEVTGGVFKRIQQL